MKKVRLGVYGAVTLLLALYVFVESVNLSPFYSEGAIFWALVISLYLLIWALFHFGEFTFQRLEAGMSGCLLYTSPRRRCQRLGVGERRHYGPWHGGGAGAEGLFRAPLYPIRCERLRAGGSVPSGKLKKEVYKRQDVRRACNLFACMRPGRRCARCV